MFVTVSDHHVSKERLAEAIALFKVNTVLGRKEKGFISRDILISNKDPLKITTVTCWEKKEQMDAWAKNPNRPKVPAGKVPMFIDMDIQVYEDVKVP